MIGKQLHCYVSTYKDRSTEIFNYSPPLTLFMDDPLKTRIVGGYMPKSRPWMALIELKQLGSRPGHYNQCGGSIINKVQIILNIILST